MKVQLAATEDTVDLVREPDGTYRFHLRRNDGGVEVLTTEEFAARVHGEGAKRGFWLTFLNITSPLGALWVGLGLLGQLLFTARMLFQWLASEKEGRSVVPPLFWWLSLAGASMLLAYFVWRKDVVGVLGQGTGWLIYLRNLWLIYRSPPSAPAAARVA